LLLFSVYPQNRKKSTFPSFFALFFSLPIKPAGHFAVKRQLSFPYICAFLQFLLFLDFLLYNFSEMKYNAAIKKKAPQKRKEGSL